MICKLRLPLAALALVLASSTPGATAQFSAYADITVVQLSGINSSPILNTLSPAPCIGSNTTNCTAYNNSVHPVGFTGGASYDFIKLGPAILSADLRGVLMSDKRGAPTYAVGPGTRLYSVLGGVKVSLESRLKGFSFSPYAEGAIGYARSNYGALTNAQISTSSNSAGIPTQGNLAYHAFAGVDLHILPYASWRIVELGYGGLSATGTYAHNYPLYTLSSGIVIHIPPRR
jgi:hypothetical protein